MQHLKEWLATEWLATEWLATEWLATFPRMFFTLPGMFEDILRMFCDATFLGMFGGTPQNV